MRRQASSACTTSRKQLDEASWELTEQFNARIDGAGLKVSPPAAAALLPVDRAQGPCPPGERGGAEDGVRACVRRVARARFLLFHARFVEHARDTNEYRMSADDGVLLLLDHDPFQITKILRKPRYTHTHVRVHGVPSGHGRQKMYLVLFCISRQPPPEPCTPRKQKVLQVLLGKHREAASSPTEHTQSEAV